MHETLATTTTSRRSRVAGRAELGRNPERLLDIAQRAFGDKQWGEHGAKDKPPPPAMPAAAKSTYTRSVNGNELLRKLHRLGRIRSIEAWTSGKGKAAT